MIVAVMTRATLGHTGRALVASPATVAAYVLLLAAALLRVFGGVALDGCAARADGSGAVLGGGLRAVPGRLCADARGPARGWQARVMGGWGEYAAAWAVFLLSHMLPARPRLRRPLVAAFGERGFVVAYSLASVAVLAWLIAAAGRAPHVPLWGWASWQAWVPNLVMPLACVLLALGVGIPNPFSIGGAGPARFDPARPGVLALTRHPVLCGHRALVGRACAAERRSCHGHVVRRLRGDGPVRDAGARCATPARLGRDAVAQYDAGYPDMAGQGRGSHWRVDRHARGPGSRRLAALAGAPPDPVRRLAAADTELIGAVTRRPLRSEYAGYDRRQHRCTWHHRRAASTTDGLARHAAASRVRRVSAVQVAGDAALPSPGAGVQRGSCCGRPASPAGSADGRGSPAAGSAADGISPTMRGSTPRRAGSGTGEASRSIARIGMQRRRPARGRPALPPRCGRDTSPRRGRRTSAPPTRSWLTNRKARPRRCRSSFSSSSTCACTETSSARDRLVRDDQLRFQRSARGRCRCAGAGRRRIRAGSGRARPAAGRPPRAARRRGRRASSPSRDAVHAHRLDQRASRWSAADRARNTGPGRRSACAAAAPSARRRAPSRTSSPRKGTRAGIGLDQPQQRRAPRWTCRSRIRRPGRRPRRRAMVKETSSTARTVTVRRRAGSPCAARKCLRRPSTCEDGALTHCAASGRSRRAARRRPC